MWWQESVVYQIYPRSFADASGDGVGDLEGLRARLEHLQWLGVDALWLSPIYRSPMADFGYDVADYCDVDPLFGDLATFDALLADAHARDIRVLLDWVPNHTSDQHPWFVESRASRDSPKRDWYRWHDGTPDGSPPNNWPAAFGGGPAWTLGRAPPSSGTCTPSCPSSPTSTGTTPRSSRRCTTCCASGWTAASTASAPTSCTSSARTRRCPTSPRPDIVGSHLDVVGTHDYDGTHALLRGIRAVLDEYPGDRMMVGEVNLTKTELIAPYLGEQRRAAPRLRLRVAARCRGRPARGARASRTSRRSWATRWPTWVFSNHDQPRMRTRLGGSEAARPRRRCSMLLTLRGTPFLFAGEELGLRGRVGPARARVDPGGRDGCRAPIPWTTAPDHGWPADPWLPWPPEPGARSVEAQRADPGFDAASRARGRWRCAATRPRCTAARLELLDDAPDGVLAYERSDGDDRRARVGQLRRGAGGAARALGRRAGDGGRRRRSPARRGRGAAPSLAVRRRAAPRPSPNPPGRTTRSPARPR